MKLYRHGRTVWNLEGRFQGAGGDSLHFFPESIDTLKNSVYLKDFIRQDLFSDLPEL